MTFACENLRETYAEMEPLYRQHYAEMQARLAEQGIETADYNPRLDQYFAAADAGWLIHYVARVDGEAVGYSNIYLTNDMHNGELIANEDTIYVTPAHRNGLGRKLAKHVLADLKQRGVKRLTIAAATDPRAALAWKRMGFKPHAEMLTYIME